MLFNKKIQYLHITHVCIMAWNILVLYQVSEFIIIFYYKFTNLTTVFT